MLRRTIKMLGVLLASTALVFGFVGTASAAPTQKGHTELSSPLLDFAEALGLLQVEAIAPATRDGSVYSFPVVGNWEMGTVKTVGGQLITNKLFPANGQISITNIWENDDLTVSGVINDDQRVTLFTIERTSADSGTLRFTAEGASLFNDFLGIPILAAGTEFGTASRVLTWPQQ